MRRPTEETGDRAGGPTPDRVERFQAALMSLVRQLRPESARLAGLDITPPQFFLLKMVACEPGMTVGSLAERLDVSPSAITVMVDRLVARGYVRREPDERDRRVVRLTATDAASDVLQRVERAYKTMLAQRLSLLREEEIEQLIKYMEIISERRETE